MESGLMLKILHVKPIVLHPWLAGQAQTLEYCFMSAADVNMEAPREVYPGVSFGSFIKKPVEIDYLAKRLLAELSKQISSLY